MGKDNSGFRRGSPGLEALSEGQAMEVQKVNEEIKRNIRKEAGYTLTTKTDWRDAVGEIEWNEVLGWYRAAGFSPELAKIAYRVLRYEVCGSGVHPGEVRALSGARRLDSPTLRYGR